MGEHLQEAVPDGAAAVRYQPYPKYKQSGVEWLGNVPEHWKVVRIKHLTPVKRGASPRPIDDPKYFDEDGEFAWVRIADVSASERYLKETTQRLSEVGDGLSVKRFPGDLFLSIAGSVGKPIITKIKCCIHDGFVYFPDFQQNNEFLYYIFACGQPYLGLGKLGTQLNLNTDTVGSILIGLPDLKEQDEIVNFLDYKTAKIDALIAKKKALLDKLAEKRTALISYAVTKGLDPKVPMRDSGIDWLGEIPAHWDFISIRWLIRIGSGDYIASTETEFDCSENASVPVIGGNGIMAYTNNFNTAENCIVIGRVGAHCGNIHFIQEKSWVTDNALRVNIISGQLDTLFFVSVLKALRLNAFANKNAQPLITGEMVKSKKIPVPPVEEQRQIHSYIEALENNIEKQTSVICRAIARLQEYRSALITNAVTGKIDVRDFEVDCVCTEEMS